MRVIPARSLPLRMYCPGWPCAYHTGPGVAAAHVLSLLQVLPHGVNSILIVDLKMEAKTLIDEGVGALIGIAGVLLEKSSGRRQTHIRRFWLV